MEKSIIHPTINLDNIDPKCDPKLDFVPKVAKERKVNYAASNSFGFGGHNACLVVGKI
jgi:3-oxoacyl-[acyl-carrier-protein] synthase II